MTKKAEHEHQEHERVSAAPGEKTPGEPEAKTTEPPPFVHDLRTGTEVHPDVVAAHAASLQESANPFPQAPPPEEANILPGQPPAEEGTKKK